MRPKLGLCYVVRYEVPWDTVGYKITNLEAVAVERSGAVVRQFNRNDKKPDRHSS